MARMVWGTTGARTFHTGIDRGVLYLPGKPGIPWNGLTSISENPVGGEEKAYYIDGVKFLSISGVEEYKATIEAFTYPDEFEECDGSEAIFPGLFLTQRRRKPFGLSYRTKIGNDLKGLDYGYKIHLVYNALAAPSNRINNTINESTSPGNFSWDISAKPIRVPGYKHSAHFVIDSRLTDPLVLADLENVLYGSDSITAHIPTQEELFNLFQAYSGFVVTDNGDGTFTVTGPDDVVEMIDDDVFQITWPTALYIDDDTYTVSSP